MNDRKRPKGPWIHRFFIRLFTLVLGILFYWVLGFLVEDIEAIKGPIYAEIEKQYVDQNALTREKKLVKELAAVGRQIKNKQAEMKIVSDSSRNLQKTIGQLIELQKLSIQKSVALSKMEQETLATSQARFIESQKQYQAHNAAFSRLNEKRQALEADRLEVEALLKNQRMPAQKEYNRLRDRHRMRLAGLQLLVLIPLLAAGAFLVVRKRSSIYFPLFLGCAVATLLKVSLVLHKYFPSKMFKYVLVLALLLAVGKLLIYFIRVVAFPKKEWLIKQYREAYERFLCPICEYPIRTGPRKYLFWTRRTVHKILLPHGTEEEEAYACPSCGTKLYERCPACEGIRHALLPHCQHCTAEKTIAGETTNIAGD